jgi:putative endonuclease
VSRAWYVYLLALGDGTLYCGVATDVDARVDAHRRGRGARYTRGRGPIEVLGVAGPFTQRTALRFELAVKRTPKPQKRARLAAGPTWHDRRGTRA